MSRFAHLIMLISYLLAVVGVIVILLLAFVPRFASRLSLTPRGGMVFVITLFLCSIASSLVRAATQAKSA